MPCHKNISEVQKRKRKKEAYFSDWPNTEKSSETALGWALLYIICKKKVDFYNSVESEKQFLSTMIERFWDDRRKIMRQKRNSGEKIDCKWLVHLRLVWSMFFKHIKNYFHYVCQLVFPLGNNKSIIHTIIYWPKLI